MRIFTASLMLLKPARYDYRNSLSVDSYVTLFVNARWALMLSGASARSGLERTNNYRTFTISWFSAWCSIIPCNHKSDYIVNIKTSSYSKIICHFYWKNKDAVVFDSHNGRFALKPVARVRWRPKNKYASTLEMEHIDSRPLWCSKQPIPHW